MQRGLAMPACLVWAMAIATPAAAQELEQDLVDQIDSLEYATQQSGPEIEFEDARRGPKPPWTIQLRMAGDRRSNANLSEDAPQGANTITSDVTIWRGRPLGDGRVFVELGALSGRSLQAPGFDTASLFGTFEYELRDRTKVLTPYAAYEPFLAYAGGFGRHLLTLHTMTLGLRRSLGATFVDVYARRVEASAVQPERFGLGVTAFHNLPLGPGILNLRGELEGRRYDRFQGVNRQDMRARFRARAIIPLASAVDAQFTVDVQHLQSSRKGFGFTNVIVGPTFIGRFGF